MAEPYLILHKVRGESAFDIATRMEVDGEEIWIIPTSGHRAYPLRTWPIEETIAGCGELTDTEEWDALPDHYQTSSSPKMTEEDFLAAVGITAHRSDYKPRRFV